MKCPGIDIIVPVWNRPEETRQCLANLLEFTPEARYILFDNASDRETEILLQEFAEALDDRALLFRYDKTAEFVALVNKGLEKADAPLIMILKNTTVVRAGWLEPLLRVVADRPDAGLFQPSLTGKKSGNSPGKKLLHSGSIEIPHAAFSGFLIRKSLYEKIGGFDEGLDGGIWCMKDYSRRAWQEGFVTVSVPGTPLFHEDSVLFGSQSKREARVRASLEQYICRWGEDRAYCLVLAGKDGPPDLQQLFEFLLGRARSGDSFTVLVRPNVYRGVVRGRFNLLHENIIVKRLPFLFATGAGEKISVRLRENTPNIIMIKDVDEIFHIGTNEIIKEAVC